MVGVVGEQQDKVRTPLQSDQQDSIDEARQYKNAYTSQDLILVS